MDIIYFGTTFVAIIYTVVTGKINVRHNNFMCLALCIYRTTFEEIVHRVQEAVVGSLMS